MELGAWCVWTVVLLQLLQCVPGGTEGALPGHMQPLGSHMSPGQVRRVSHLPSPREFSEGYVAPKTPLIIEGALKNSAVWRDWQDDQYLRDHFGEVEANVERGKKENRSDPHFTSTMAQYLDRYKEEDIYLVDNLPEPMYNEWLVPRPLFCGGFKEHYAHTFMWFSSGGSKSVLHTDSFENFHCLVSGRKEFVLIEPHYANVIGTEHAQQGFFNIDVEKVDMTLYPELSKIPWLYAEVLEGDCLYLPYEWLHNVNSFKRNMGINIWWFPFEFDDSDCPPPEAELPEYFPLSQAELSPEMEIMVVLSRSSRDDGSVHSEDIFKMIRETNTIDIELGQVQQLLEFLQPGCDGVIADYTTIQRAQLKQAYQYMMSVHRAPEGGTPPEDDEYYYPLDEFGGQGMDYDPDMTEGGGDFAQHQRDEL